MFHDTKSSSSCLRHRIIIRYGAVINFDPLIAVIVIEIFIDAIVVVTGRVVNLHVVEIAEISAKNIF